MTRPKILLVDDKPQNLYALEKILQKLDVDLFQTTSSMEALGLALENDFCVAIVDVQMPEMDGYELVALLRGNESTARLPVIFVSAIYADEYHHRKGYDAGAVDFLSKPFVPEILLSKVNVFIDLYNQRQELESLVEQFHRTNMVLERRTMQMDISRRVGAQITSILDLDELLTAIVYLIHNRFEYYFTGLWLWNDAKDHLRLRISMGQAKEKLPPGFTVPIMANDPIIQVSTMGQPQLLNSSNSEEVPETVTMFPGIQSVLMVPIQLGNKKVGVLDVRSPDADIFGDDDIAVLQLLGNQMAIAIRNASLYDQVKRFNEELESRVRERTRELEEAYHALALLDQNKSDFIQVVAHELRTPLSVIKGYGEMLHGDKVVQSEEMPRRLVSGMLNGIKRMHEVVNTMLDIMKIDNQALQLLPDKIALSYVMAVLQEKMAQSLHERQLTLAVQDITTIPNIEADPDLLHKLFHQLLLNAIKYTPDGGDIMIYGRLLDNNVLETDEEFVEIVIEDTGIGIDPEFHEMIFTKFYQTGKVSLHSSGKTKFKAGGPGLGLAIAQGIVEAHGGRIWVESERHDDDACPGSRFHVILPVVFSGKRFEIA